MLKKTFAVLALLFCLLMPTAFAEVQTIEADGYSDMAIQGEGPNESPAVVMERARSNAKRAASEQAGLFIESISEVKNGKLTKDEIRTISSTVLQVKSDPVTHEIVGGAVIRYHCHITALVDTANVLAQLNPQNKEDFDKAVQRNKELEAEIARVNAELAALKEKYKTASDTERQEINKEVKSNEDEFTAAQWVEKSVELLNKKDYDGAVEACFKAIDIDPQNASAWISLGDVYTYQWKYDKAIEYYNKALELDPKNALAWHNLGRAYGFNWQGDKGMESYNKALELNPKYRPSWFHLGWSYRDKGQYDKAIECFRKAVDLDPKDAEAWTILGFAYKSNGQDDKTMECYNKALELGPKAAYSWLWIGSFYNGKGQYNKAIEYLRKSVDLGPKNANAWAILGKAYYNSARYQEAINAYDEAIRLNPNNKKYKEWRDDAEKKLKE